MLYSVSQQFYFRELRRGVPAGATVYLDDEVAAKYAVSQPGLLKPMRQTTQASIGAVRSGEADTPADPEGKKKPARKPAK